MYIVKGLRVIVLFKLMPLIRGSRGGTGGSNPHPPPLVNHKDKAILINHKDTKAAFTLGPSLARQRNAI